MNDSKKTFPVHTIAVHVGPHLEEAISIVVLKNYGEPFFPGISQAKIEFWGFGGETPDGRSAAEWLNEGVLAVGTGRGQLDEHATLTEGRKQGKSSLTLVAEYLGLIDEPWMEKIIRVVTDEDLNASSGMLSLATILKMKHAQSPDKQIDNLNWAIEGMAAIFKHQLTFFNETAAEFAAKAKIEKVVGPHGKMIAIATIVTDNPQMAKYARSKHGGNVAVAIVQNAKGNVQIFPNQEFVGRMTDTLQMVRLEEQKKRGKVLTTRWDELAAEGNVAGAECWYFQERGQMIFNGSLSNPDVEPTVLTIDEIVAIVKIGVSPRTFEPVRHAACEANKCSSSRAKPCPWYDWGLHRCRQARFYQSHPQAASHAA